MDIQKLHEYLDPEQDNFEKFCKNFLQDLLTKQSLLREIRAKRSVENINIEYLNRVEEKITNLTNILMVAM